MGIKKLKVVLTEEAQAFLDAQPFKAQQKIYYNIFKVEEGVMKRDFGYCHTWHSQENSEDTTKGNCQSRRYKKRVL